MKRRYSFVGKKHTLKIDDDIQVSAEQYVKDQLAILKRYNDNPEPDLTASEYSDLVYDVARHPQMIRNLEAQIKRKREREAKKVAREARAIEKAIA